MSKRNHLPAQKNCAKWAAHAKPHPAEFWGGLRPVQVGTPLVLRTPVEPCLQTADVLEAARAGRRFISHHFKLCTVFQLIEPDEKLVCSRSMAFLPTKALRLCWRPPSLLRCRVSDPSDRLQRNISSLAATPLTAKLPSSANTLDKTLSSVFRRRLHRQVRKCESQASLRF